MKLESAEPAALGLEIGIGSGAISIELLAAFPSLSMLASELTAEASAARARECASEFWETEADRGWRSCGPPTRSKSGSRFRALGGRRADFLISNPPYLDRRDPIEAEVRDYEPAAALFAPAS